MMRIRIRNRHERRRWRDRAWVLVGMLGAAGCDSPSRSTELEVVESAPPAVVRIGAGHEQTWVPATGRDAVEVRLWIDRELVSGVDPRRGVTVVEWEGIGRGRLSTDRQHVAVSWAWADGVEGPRSIIQLPELPAIRESDGGMPLTLRWEWDAEQGRMTEFIGGHAQRALDARFPNDWDMPAGGRLSIPRPGGGPLPLKIVSATAASSDALPRTEPRGELAGLFGVSTPPPIEVADRRGGLIYENQFDEADAVADWVVEGPMRVEVREGQLHLSSTKPDAQRPDHGHGVLWPPVELPEAYVVDWTFTPNAQSGLAIVFFDTRPNLPGVKNLFDPAMPIRDGTFSQYWNGAIDAYHLSYFADTPDNPGRGYSNLRKDPGLTMMAVGQPAISASTVESTQLRLIRDGRRIQLQADGRVVIDTTDDDPRRFGPPLNGGRLGFRQMQWTRGSYDNLRIHRLLGHNGPVSPAPP